MIGRRWPAILVAFFVILFGSLSSGQGVPVPGSSGYQGGYLIAQPAHDSDTLRPDATQITLTTRADDVGSDGEPAAIGPDFEAIASMVPSGAAGLAAIEVLAPSPWRSVQTPRAPPLT